MWHWRALVEMDAHLLSERCRIRVASWPSDRGLGAFCCNNALVPYGGELLHPTSASVTAATPAMTLSFHVQIDYYPHRFHSLSESLYTPPQETYNRQLITLGLTNDAATSVQAFYCAYKRINSSETAAGVKTPRSVNINVMKLAGVKSTAGKSTVNADVVVSGDGEDAGEEDDEEEDEEEEEEAAVVVVVVERRDRVMARVSFCDSGYIRENLYDSTAT